MKSKWKVSNNPIMEDRPYIVVRIRDIDKIDHSGNREYYGDYMASKQEAQAIADKLNSEVTE